MWMRNRERGRETSALGEAQFARAPDRLAPAGDLQLAEDAVGVGLAGADGDRQAPGDLGVGPAGGDQPQHLELPRAQRLQARLVGPDTWGRSGRTNVPRSDTASGRVVS